MLNINYCHFRGFLDFCLYYCDYMLKCCNKKQISSGLRWRASMWDYRTTLRHWAGMNIWTSSWPDWRNCPPTSSCGPPWIGGVVDGRSASPCSSEASPVYSRSPSKTVYMQQHFGTVRVGSNLTWNQIRLNVATLWQLALQLGKKIESNYLKFYLILESKFIFWDIRCCHK